MGSDESYVTKINSPLLSLSLFFLKDPPGRAALRCDLRFGQPGTSELEISLVQTFFRHLRINSSLLARDPLLSAWAKLQNLAETARKSSEIFPYVFFLFILLFILAFLVQLLCAQEGDARIRAEGDGAPMPGRDGSPRREEAASRALQRTAARLHYARTGRDLGLISLAILRERPARDSARPCS